MRHRLSLGRWAARRTRHGPLGQSFVEPGPVLPVRRGSRGQSMIEFALILPIFLLLLAGAVDLGRMFYAYVAVENATKEGALYGAQNPQCATVTALCPDPQNVTWRVQNETGAAALAGGIQAGAIQCLAPSGPFATPPGRPLITCVDGDTYVVNASHEFRLITPILSSILGTGLTLSSQSQAKVLNEAFDPTPGAALLKYVCAGDGCTNFVQTPTLDSANHPVYLEATARQTLRYRLSVTNIGGQALTGLTITDSVVLPLGTSGCPALPATLARNATWTCVYPRTAPNPTVGQPSLLLSNSATFDAAEINSVPQVAIVEVLPAPAELTVTKNVSPYKLGGDGDGVPRFGDSPTLRVYYPATGNRSVWFHLTVTNTGGVAATGLAITDSLGADGVGTLPVNADCPAIPGTLNPNAQWACSYQRTFAPGDAGAHVNVVVGHASNAPDDSATATVTVNPYADCAPTGRVVPSLIGLTKTAAQSAWTAAGFTSGNLNTWNGQNSDAVVTQSRLAYGCLSTSGSMQITRVTTP